jgi:hypothetical protein
MKHFLNNNFAFNFSSFHNFSDYSLNSTEEKILALGTKFIVTPKPLSDKDIIIALRDFYRRLRLKVHFFNEQMKKNKIPRFYVPNPLWDPRSSKYYKHNETLEEYITEIDKDIYHNMNRPIQKTKRNLNKEMYQALKSLRQNQNIVIRPTDKNLGPIVLNKQWYIKKMTSQLENNDTYMSIDRNVAEILERSFMGTLPSTLEDCKLPNSVIDYICEFSKNHNVPVLHGLPKIHKIQANELSLPLEEKLHHLNLRLISGAHSYLNSRLSEFIAYVLNHSVSQHKTILPDSFELVKQIAKTKIREEKIGEETFLVTIDVKELYPSIPTSELKTRLAKYYVPHPDYRKLSFDHLKSLLDKLFMISFSIFNDTLYKQNKGLTMGTSCAPQLANFFLLSLELPLITSYTGLVSLFRRFLDDVFFVFVGTRQQLAIFLSHYEKLHPDIKITWVISTTSIPYMDIEIYKGKDFKTTRILSTRIYQKPLNKFLYIPPFSFHNKHIFKAFIKGELIRYVRFSSSQQDFEKIRCEFFLHLLARKYDVIYLLDVFRNVSYNDRNKYLIKKKDKQDEKKDILIFKIAHNPRIRQLEIRNTLLRHWHIIDEDHLLNKVFPNKPILCLFSNTNLGGILAPSNPFKDNNEL